MEPDSLAALEKRQLDDHFQRYNDLSKLLITLSTASIAMLTALTGTLVGTSPAQASMHPWSPLLAASLLCGLLVQYLVCMRPLQTIRRARIANANHERDAALGASSTGGPVEISVRQPPTLTEQIAFFLQVATFAGAFATPAVRLLYA